MPEYNQSFHPQINKYDVGKVRNQVMEYSLSKILTISIDLIKFVVRFIVDGIKSVIGMAK